MATAVRRQELVAVPPPTYRLDLTEAEAGVIIRLADHIGGGWDGPRGDFAAIGTALEGAGATAITATPRLEAGLEPALYFN